MKDYLKQIIENSNDNNTARSIVREYLQSRLLESLQISGAFSNWAFLGGTALRFLYSLNRFSEDLDFSITNKKDETAFLKNMKKSKTLFEREGYDIEIKANEKKTVQSALIKFPGLLHELNLSQHASERISIKIEIDTNPPLGANFETTIIRKYCMLNILHYDKPSLLAGKLHALLARKYVKGRDIYDLVWYLSDKSWPEPNLTFLNNALIQSKWKGSKIESDNWKEQMSNRIATFDWTKVIADIRPFVQHERELQLISKENVLKLLQ